MQLFTTHRLYALQDYQRLEVRVELRCLSNTISWIEAILEIWYLMTRTSRTTIVIEYVQDMNEDQWNFQSRIDSGCSGVRDRYLNRYTMLCKSSLQVIRKSVSRFVHDDFSFFLVIMLRRIRNVMDNWSSYHSIPNTFRCRLSSSQYSMLWLFFPQIFHCYKFGS